MIQLNSTIFIVAISLSLMNCNSGGSSGGNSSNSVSPNTNPRQVLRTFSDGSGIGHATSLEDQNIIYLLLIDSDINEWKSNHDPTGPGNAFDISRVSRDRSLQYADEYSGPLGLNGRDLDSVIYFDRRSNTLMLYTAGVSSEQLGITGSLPSTFPTGRLDYVGQNIMTGVNLNYFYIGTFGMSVNFSSGEGRITGTALDGSNVISRVAGTFNVNRENGKITSDENLTFTWHGLDGTNEDKYSASMYGNFHGKGAEGVSGIYFSEMISNRPPNYFGSIIGAKMN